MSTNRAFGSLPTSTINPSKIGAGTTNVFDVTSWRPLQWMHDPSNENLQQPENISALWTLLDTLPAYGNDWTNPTIWWRVEDRLNMNTSLAAALTAADTYMSVSTSLLLKAGYVIAIPSTGEQLLVLEVDDDLSEGWTNDNSVACNVRIDRSLIAGPTLAATAGAEVRASLPLMGEFGEPKEGIATIPGDPLYNHIQLFGLYISMSVMQRNSLMTGKYGTHQDLMETNESYLSQQLQTALLFGRRMAYNHDDEGQIYMTNGLIAQIQDNVLSVGGVGNTYTFQNISDFIEGTFESANSSASKYVACGEQLYMNILNTARQEGHIVEESMYSPALGVDQFTFTTAGGKTVTVGKFRFAFMGELKDWGIVLDLANIATAEYAGFGWRWLTDLEPKLQAITKSTDALVGSTSVTIADPSTCGVIKGGVNPVIAPRTDLGIVVSY